MTNKTKAIEAGKTFRKRLNEETESDTKQRNYAAEKQAEREPKYREGWKNFSVMVPADCVEYLKNALETYKNNHPHLFGKEEAEEGDTD